MARYCSCPLQSVVQSVLVLRLSASNPAHAQVDVITAKIDTAMMAAEDRLPAVGGSAPKDVDHRRRRVPVSLPIWPQQSHFCWEGVPAPAHREGRRGDCGDAEWAARV